MHVCFFAHKNNKNNDGATLSLINIANEMTNRGIEVTIIIPSKKLEYSIENKNIKVVKIPAYSMRTKRNDYSKINKLKEIIKIFYNRFSIYKTIKVIKHKRPDLIHINGLDSEVGAIIAKKLQIPYIWHIRQLLEEDLDRRLHNEKKIYNLLKQSNEIIAISKVVKEKFEAKLNKKLKLIYNGIPLNDYINEEDKELFKNEKINLLLAGRIVKQKGQLDAVKAVSHLIRSEKMNNIHLTIAGNIHDSSYAEKVSQYIKENHLHNYIEIIDHVSDLKELRMSCDIGLICSKKEAFGRVTIETMVSKMLVIGSNTGGTAEIITNNRNGLLYEEGNYHSLAEQIKYAINNKDKVANIVKNGYNDAINNYSIEGVVDKIIELYKPLIK